MNSFGILSQLTYTPLTCNHSDTDKSSRFNIVIHMNMWHHSVNRTLLLLYLCSSKHTTTSSQTHCAFLQHVVFGTDERLNCWSVVLCYEKVWYITQILSVFICSMTFKLSTFWQWHSDNNSYRTFNLNTKLVKRMLENLDSSKADKLKSHVLHKSGVVIINMSTSHSDQVLLRPEA